MKFISIVELANGHTYIYDEDGLTIWFKLDLDNLLVMIKEWKEKYHKEDLAKIGEIGKGETEDERTARFCKELMKNLPPVLEKLCKQGKIGPGPNRFTEPESEKKGG